MIVWFTPSMIDGFASGICTFRSVWRAVEPNASATSSEVVGTQPDAQRGQSDRGRQREDHGGDQRGRRADTEQQARTAAGTSTQGSSASRPGPAEAPVRLVGWRPAQIPSGMPISQSSITANEHERQGLDALVPRRRADRRKPARRQQGHPPSGRPYRDHGRGRRRRRTTSCARAPGIALSTTDVMTSSDRVQDVDEQRVRRLVLDHPVAEGIEPARSTSTTQRSGNPGVSQASPIARSRHRRRATRSVGATGSAPSVERRPRLGNADASRRLRGVRSPSPALLHERGHHASRSTTPTTSSPSITRIGRSTLRPRCGISSCTTVVAATRPPAVSRSISGRRA